MARYKARPRKARWLTKRSTNDTLEKKTLYMYTEVGVPRMAGLDDRFANALIGLMGKEFMTSEYQFIVTWKIHKKYGWQVRMSYPQIFTIMNEHIAKDRGFAMLHGAVYQQADKVLLYGTILEEDSARFLTNDLYMVRDIPIDLNSVAGVKYLCR